MQSIALVIHVALAIGLIGLVLIQHGKGADAGAAFGSGASATVFGARGSASFMTRMTTGVASAFFLTSLLLFYLAANRDRGLDSVTDLPGSVVEEPADETPADAPVSDLPGGVEEDSSQGSSSNESDMPAAGAPDAAGDGPADSASDQELPPPPEAAPAAAPAAAPENTPSTAPADDATKDQEGDPAAK